ncbi:MAG: RNA polymerase sigma factor [Methylophilaceae bacterium]|jgi:RNA polymerase sigma-70 factor, ECF subfamily|nr:RNA polymerase sigma factor [Methylophilaceae bacterium]MDG1454415.1 RNA polymerase sigma factor [Methylophilaceae bacterium]
MASSQELSDFLRDVERRAFKQTAYAVRDDHAAMDIVQDAMLKLADKYPDKPVTEYPMLFQRILQNTMRDFWRRQKVRALWTTLLSSFSTQSDDGEARDPLDTMDVDDGFQNPATQLEGSQTLQVIETALQKLPARQREAFVLRYWEEMSVAETAESMGCSEGSVKTHCSRALHTMAALLAQQGLGIVKELNT